MTIELDEVVVDDGEIERCGSTACFNLAGKTFFNFTRGGATVTINEVSIVALFFAFNDERVAAGRSAPELVTVVDGFYFAEG